MATVETILDKIENIKDSKSKIINTLLKNGAEVSQDALLKEIPDVIEEQSIGGGGTALNEHINTLATTNQYGHVRLATSLDDNDTGVAPSIDLLNGEFASKFVTHGNILGGISTQTIFGYDSVSDTPTNNTIYLDDDHLVVHSGGNEISFPKKEGTVALTSDIAATSQATKSEYGTVKISSTLSETTDNIVPSISQVNTLLEDKANTAQVFRDTREVAQNASNGIANLLGWSGTLSDLNVSFERVGISTLSLKKRTGSAPSNTAYARIVHIGSSGTVEMLFQSKNSVSWGNVAAGAVVTYEMEHITGRVYPTNTERVALYFVSNKTDADGISNSSIGLQTESGKGGALIANQSSTTSLPGGQSGYRPVIGLTYYNAIDNLESRLIETIETKLDKSHEDIVATHLKYGHVKLGTQYTIDTADDNFGVIGKTSNGQLAYRMDSVPTSGSRLPLKSGGVYQALSEKQDVLTAGDNITIENGTIGAVLPVASKNTLGAVRVGNGLDVVNGSLTLNSKLASFDILGDLSLLKICSSEPTNQLILNSDRDGYSNYACLELLTGDEGEAEISGGRKKKSDNSYITYRNIDFDTGKMLGFESIEIGSVTIDEVAWNEKQGKLTAGDNISIENGTISVTNIDTTPTAGSNNLVSSGGVKSYIDSIVGDIKSRLEAL